MPKVGFYDYVTLACVLTLVIAFLTVLCVVLGLPGRIARARKHPEADAIYVMGWLGFLGVVPWIQAFIWAFKPTDVVDIRRFPKQEAEAEAREFAADTQAASRRGRSRQASSDESSERSSTDDASSSTGTATSEEEDSQSGGTDQVNGPQDQ
jgi:hypothetical protein